MSRKINIEIEQGSTFNYDIELLNTDNSDFDVDGWTGHGAIRKHYLSETQVPFEVTLVDGMCTFKLSAEETAELEYGLYVYDIVITDSNEITKRIISGMATVSPSVYR